MNWSQMKQGERRVFSQFCTLAGIVLFLGLAPTPLRAQTQLIPPLPAGVTEGAGIIKNKQWAIALGKALFWDHQAGSDGNACASCHFHAGADTRLTNQLNPGFKDITFGPNGDVAFGSLRSDTGEVQPGQMPSGARADSNYTLQPEDMPLHRLLDETNRNSKIRTTTNDRVSSQGAFDQLFDAIRFFGAPDVCSNPNATIFHAGSQAARQVEPRNTPTVINAVFNHRNFLDGRANNMFNGVSTFGMRDINADPNKRLLIFDANGKPQATYLTLENASLASQAVTPVVSSVEMSCNGRTFADVGRRLLLTIPLLGQDVDPTDSVLGPLRSPWGLGLALPNLYFYMIQRAFDPKWWSGTGRYKMVNGAWTKSITGHSQMENNFSMFWGIAIMMYESTLISNQSEFDTLVASGDIVTSGGGRADCITKPNVDPLLARGCKLFHRAPFGPLPLDKVRGVGCLFCHGAPLFSEATFQAGQTFTPFLNPVTDINNKPDIRDLGFANIGLRPVFSDQFLGRTDPYGNPLSFGRQFITGNVVDPFLQQAITSGRVQASILSHTVTKLETDGASKVPTMRNVALTPPYFSWGGYPSLRQVLKTYNRGLNRRDITGPNSPEADGSNACVSGDSSGSGPDGNHSWPVNDPDCNTNTTGLIVPLGLLDCDANGQPNPACANLGRDVTNDDLAAIVRFLKSLTDPRVQCDQAPFDHPSLLLTNGHQAESEDESGLAEDITFKLPAIGAAGYPPQSGYCIANAGDLFFPGMQARSGGLRVPLQ